MERMGLYWNRVTGYYEGWRGERVTSPRLPAEHSTSSRSYEFPGGDSETLILRKGYHDGTPRAS